MPKIVELKIYKADLPFRKPFKHAAAERTSSDSLFLRCKTDAGAVGFGECLPRKYVTGETRKGVFNLLKDSKGEVKVGGSSFTDGNDNLPAGWTDCPALGPPLPGIQLPDSSDIETTGCSGLSCVAGSPKVEEDPTINDSTLTTFGDATFDDWRSLATKFITGGTRKIEPSLTSGACNKADPNNWGSPLAPTGACGGYFPIVWVEGNLNINGVQGQGVLLVNGDLDVQGGFEFFGPVLVKGRLSTQGTGGHFNGGVIAANVDLEQNTVLGNAVMQG